MEKIKKETIVYQVLDEKEFTNYSDYMETQQIIAGRFIELARMK